MRRFVLYRRNPPKTYRQGGYANPPAKPQLEGVVFTDGTTVIRWLTRHKSTSVWRTFAVFEAVHGHPEYDSELVWFDPDPLHLDTTDL